MVAQFGHDEIIVLGGYNLEDYSVLRDGYIIKLLPNSLNASI